MSNQSNSTEVKIKHLEMIEAVIQRMAHNSFQLKGWTVTLVSIISAIVINGASIKLMVLPLLPLFSFWILDAHYLQLERKYQILYRNVTEQKTETDFSMDIRKIKTNADDESRISTFGCFFSKTEICFYGFILVAIIMLVIMKKCCL